MTLAWRLAAAMAETPVVDLLAGDMADDIVDPSSLTDAGVLVAITDRAAPGVILTQRTETLRRHAGQIAFPGGRADAEDADIVATALREAEEEIALPPAAVTVVGIADRYRTVTGYAVTPVIGIVPPDLPLVPAEAEVASVFEVPLAFLLDPANHVRASAHWRGQDRHFFEIMWNDRRIWGATAAMIVNLSRRLAATPAWVRPAA
ncbi:CoA pyrophosphatase [Sphingomonas carotinifaciens]|uniref:8-oxo-dGTP pyrophosphatase MutT, NUDIX family n=1 Tax=Sphingomonas carotinifaciens TaxID=1166323 RepID=A0A1G7FAE3_9SPHN|nr:CoA pyrophosphatase [Sphingomonas carotinifaciens]MBB4085958.1 8-oxo-dGTP pyrophosphatase MutT (NUDIX family) [Sphingomonas carotinifaciens]MWC45345.1 CoA pyrophosphatase [Sphingomonas carotinifaciens]SDE72842.1 8-oxo-dGTP pyrophosphatase MutT, NUDIX family [Sphingomonas carotinifaciens]